MSGGGVGGRGMVKVGVIVIFTGEMSKRDSLAEWVLSLWVKLIAVLRVLLSSLGCVAVRVLLVLVV